LTQCSQLFTVLCAIQWAFSEHIFIKILFKIKYRAKRAKKMRKYGILGIKIIGPWPLDPLVICLVKITSNCIYKGKENFVRGGEKYIISVKQRLAKLLGRRPPPLPPRYLRPCYRERNIECKHNNYCIVFIILS